MSEGQAKPEILPGDLITGPGVYMSRSNNPVEVRDCGNGYWEAAWEDGDLRYHSSGERVGVCAVDDPYQLIRWVGPLAEDIPTTGEQLAEIEGQAEDTPATEYTPTEHWRVLQVGEPLKGGDEYHEGLNSYIRRIEVSQPEAEPVSKPQPEPQAESDAELRIRALKQCNDNQAETIKRLMAEARDLSMEIGGLQRQTEQQKSRIEFLETLNAGNGAAITDYIAKVAKLQGLVDTARGQLEAAATERDELRAAIDAADKQLDQKDAQIRNLRIELDAAQQVPQPVGDEEREQIWDEATETAGRLVIGWLTPLTGALIKQPDERFCRFMAMTLSILPDILPELLGYAVEDESLDTDEDGE